MYFDIPRGYPQTQSLYYGLIETLTRIGGLPLAKSLLLIMPAAIGLLLYKTLGHFTESKMLAALLGSLIVVYPIAPRQAYFLTGAHPTAGLVVFMAIAYLYIEFLKGKPTWPPIRNVGYFLLCGVGFLIISKTSPTFILTPFLLLPMAGLVLWADRARLTIFHIAYVATPIGVLLFLFINSTDYHYASLAGWTDMSASQSFSNLAKTIAHIASSPFLANTKLIAVAALAISVFFATLIGTGSLVGAAKIRESYPAGHHIWPLLLFLLLGCALAFGPGSTTTNFQPRYAIAPFQIGALMFGIITVVIFAQFPGRAGRLKFSGISALFVFTGIIAVQGSVLASRGLLRTHDAHEKVVAELNKREWASDDQILILLPKGDRESTRGYNHWSTWYLRMVTKTPGLIGLVGEHSREPDLQRNGLFVDVYRDHDPVFWSVTDGVATRAQMLGLTRDRSTYAYAARDGVLTLMPLRTHWATGMKELQPGQRFDRVNSTGLDGTAPSGIEPSEDYISVRIADPL